MIDEGEYLEMWSPWLYVVNLENHGKCQRTDKKEVIKIIPNSENEYTRSPFTNLQNAYLFNGSKSKIFDEKEWTCEFICSFDYRWYPFDTQNCPIILSENQDLEVILISKMFK